MVGLHFAMTRLFGKMLDVYETVKQSLLQALILATTYRIVKAIDTASTWCPSLVIPHKEASNAIYISLLLYILIQSL